ncbi:hypothetical protein ACHAC9_23880 [Massilia sp. CMS3.1]|uniref:hypothetical protein n=1 Tax=Massilia sp. CMS3.1 TaxID=3373083 RepID=UPI003EE6F150
MAAEPFNLVDRELNEGPSPYLYGYPDVYGEDAKPETSPYYWWFMYLKRHEGYKACCERGGTGGYAAVYADWGDVRTDDFEKWFFEYGDSLFREPHVRDDLGEIETASQLAEVNLQDTMVVAIPIRFGRRALSKKEIKHQFSMLLDERFPDSEAGRPVFESEAKYRFAGYPQLEKLKKRLLIYDTAQANSEWPDWKLGEELAKDGKLPDGLRFITNSDEKGKFGEHKRNQMATLVGKLRRQAEKQIENAVTNVFKVA